MNIDDARHAFDAASSDEAQDFGNFFIFRLLGLNIEYSDETSTITVPVRDFLFNPQGSMHGGILATVMDIAMGHLLRHAYQASGATLEMKVQYFKPLRDGVATCQARFLQRGKSIAFLEASLRNDASELIAMATSTWKCLNSSNSPK